MRNLKKFLALVLAMMMALSLMVTVQAKDVVTEFPDTDTIIDEFYEDVTVLAGMKVIQGHGDTGTFAPQALVTRAQMAAIVYRLATGDVSDARAHVYKDYYSFKDVTADKWYAGYVGYCADAGYIQGYPDGSFKPDAPVTGYAALAMVLRAMGYNQEGHNFTGSTWKAEVGSTATQRGMMVNINKSVYANTLNYSAPRELVAEMAFQGATKAMVQYTNAFGYQTTGMNSAGTSAGVTASNQNPSLGKLYFGLDAHTSVVVGNQATGEGCTLLTAGGSQKYLAKTSQNVMYADFTYAYPGSTVVASSAIDGTSPADIVAPAGLKLAGKTGLDLFGHNVTAWYDNRVSGAKPTYAIFDRATHTAVVNSPLDAADTGAEASQKLSASGASANPALAGLGVAALRVGFSVNLEGSTAHTSNAYDRITSGTNANAAQPADPTRAAGFGMYALVSNSGNKAVDVVVTLNIQVARITRQDTVATTKTLTLGSSSFGTWNTGHSDLLTDGVIPTASIVSGSETTLGARVAAHQVIGTNDAWKYVTDTTPKDGYEDSGLGYVGTNYNMPYFYLEKLSEVVTGTVRTFDGDGTITFTTGEKIEKSWLYDQIKSGYSTPDTFLAGVTYTLALDNDGRWLGVTTAPNSFLYATFADYEIGALGTGTIQYAVTGVNWDGEKVINHPLTAINLDKGFSGAWNTSAGSSLYPYGTNTLGDGYNLLPFSIKDQGQPAGGNQIKYGDYTGYSLSSDGVLTSTTFDAAGNALSPTDLQAVGANLLQEDWAVTKADVVKGFVAHPNGQILLTNTTKFIVVSGTGSADLDVKIYNGIGEFLGDADQVVFNATSTPKGNTYYRTTYDMYNQWAPVKNNLVETVICDARDLTYTSTQSLYFAAPGTDETGVQLAGTVATDNIEQYVLWNNGVKSTYFVKKDVAGGGPADGRTDGTFYTLVQINTINGTPIYKANAVEAPKCGPYVPGGICWTNQSYIYQVTSELNTALIGTQVMNVTNATVVDVEYNPITCGHTEIKSVKDLADAISGGWDDVKVSIVNDGAFVSIIYVTQVAKT